MTYLVMVSNAHGRVVHGPWARKETARTKAEQWARVFARRGWKLQVSIVPLLDKDAATRDKLAAALVELAEAKAATRSLGATPT